MMKMLSKEKMNEYTVSERLFMLFVPMNLFLLVISIFPYQSFTGSMAVVIGLANLLDLVILCLEDSRTKLLVITFVTTMVIYIISLLTMFAI